MKPILPNTCRAVAEYLHASPQQVQSIVRTEQGPLPLMSTWLPRLAKSIKLLVPSEKRKDAGVLRATSAILFAIMTERHWKGECNDPLDLPPGKVYSWWADAWRSRVPTGDPELDRVAAEIEELPSVIPDPHQDELFKLISRLSNGHWITFTSKSAAEHLGVSHQKVADLLGVLRDAGHIETDKRTQTSALYRASNLSQVSSAN